VFSLTKTGDVWTLHYEVSPMRRVLMVGAGLASLGFGLLQSPAPSAIAGLVICVGCLGLMAYWVVTDLPSTASFDLARHRLTLRCERPWFGPPRAYAFADVAALYAVKRSGESVDSWEATIELFDGSRIKLGRETEGRNERVRGYLEEIRKATGIAGR
jgi:hypothetical protein